MEGPVEVKDSVVVSEEPIKSEAPVQNPDSSDRSYGAVSPPPNCSICLGKLENTSFTDSCLHQFCFNCLLQWSKIKTECPLCKQTFKSIIHSVRSEEDYDQYHVPRELAVSLDMNYELDHSTDTERNSSRFRYRTTVMGYPRRVLNPEQVARREQLPSIAPRVSMVERLRRRYHPIAYRQTIYRLGIWASPLPDAFGNFRECSVDIYRRDPAELSRLIPWLNRELQVLLNNNAAYVAYALTVILEYLVQYDIRSQEFRDLLRPHLGEFTAHFVYELLNFARSNFDLVGYDQSVVYLPQGLSNEYVSNVLSPTSSSSSFSSDDPDIRVLDEAIDLRMNTEIPSMGPHMINLPGPSTVTQTLQLIIPRPVPDVLTISSDFTSSDDDCEVIGYVKPRHERTPEIIELVSSDPEEIDISHVPNDSVEVLSSPLPEGDVQPSTSTHNNSSIKKRVWVPTSSESDSDSDSDYVCKKSRAAYASRSRKRTKKSATSTKRRNGSMETRIRVRSTKTVSNSGENDLRKRGSKRNTQRNVKRRSSSSSSSTSTTSTSSTSTTTSDSVFDACVDSSSSSSESDEVSKSVRQSRTVRKSKRRYVTSSSDRDTGRQLRVPKIYNVGTKTRKQASDVKDSSFYGKESRYKEERRSASRSSSASSYTSQKDKKASSRRREFQRDANNGNELDNSTWASKDVSRKDRESKYKTRNVIRSSSEDDFRSHSQCSNYSSKSYTYRRKSKHKDRRKSKKRKRSTSRSHGSSNKSRSTRRHPG